MMIAKRTYHNERDAHELEQSSTFFIVFSCHFDRPAGKLVHILGGPYFFCFFPSFFSLFSLGVSVLELESAICF